jgi:uncharacterized membrane protein YkoI
MSKPRFTKARGRQAIMLPRTLLTGWLLALLCVAILLPAAATGKDRQQDCKRSQDCALDAFKSGQIRPLSEVLAVAREKLPGEVVKIELEREDGAWVYEIKVLTPSGRRREIEINAQTLAVIKIE